MVMAEAEDRQALLLTLQVIPKDGAEEVVVAALRLMPMLHHLQEVDYIKNTMAVMAEATTVDTVMVIMADMADMEEVAVVVREEEVLEVTANQALQLKPMPQQTVLEEGIPEMADGVISDHINLHITTHPHHHLQDHSDHRRRHHHHHIMKEEADLEEDIKEVIKEVNLEAVHQIVSQELPLEVMEAVVIMVDLEEVAKEEEEDLEVAITEVEEEEATTTMEEEDSTMVDLAEEETMV